MIQLQECRVDGMKSVDSSDHMLVWTNSGKIDTTVDLEVLDSIFTSFYIVLVLTLHDTELNRNEMLVAVLRCDTLDRVMASSYAIDPTTVVIQKNAGFILVEELATWHDTSFSGL